MKNSIIIITTLFLSLFGTPQLQAQEFNSKKNNYLVLSQNIKQLKPVLLTASELAKEDGKKHGVFYVIICGKTVNDIANNTAFKELLAEAKAQSVKVFVCGFSLQQFNISPTQMPSNLEFTENGILFGFQLSKKGFISLTL